MSVQNKNKFAFIVHPRTIADLYIKFPYLKSVPVRILKILLKKLPPFKVALITGLQDETGRKVTGEIITVAITAEQMLNDRILAKKHVLKAIEKAQKRGASHIGLGAYTSVVTAGGAETKGVVSGVHITNGNALTAYMTYLGIKKLIEKYEGHKPIISIIGATGSIGSAVTELLTRDGCFETLYVVGRTPSSIVSLLERLKSHLHFSRVQNAVIADALPKSDIVLSATSANGAIVDADLLKKNAIIYDITQPKNIPIDLNKKRPDVTLIDGGLVQYPVGVKIHFDMGVPKGATFSCLAETMLLSLSNYPDDFCLGHVTLEQVSYVGALAEKYGFIPVSNSR